MTDKLVERCLTKTNQQYREITTSFLYYAGSVDAAENPDESSNGSRAAKRGVNVKVAPFFLMRRDDVSVLLLQICYTTVVERLLIAFGKSSSLICLIRKKKENVIV
jgi:hypothetical protein